jgi:hypothetical protein
MFYSTHKALANQKREMRSQISGAVIANTAHETGNPVERDAANATAAAAIATEVAALVSGGHVRAKQMISQYSVEELRAAYARSIA